MSGISSAFKKTMRVEKVFLHSFVQAAGDTPPQIKAHKKVKDFPMRSYDFAGLHFRRAARLSYLALK